MHTIIDWQEVNISLMEIGMLIKEKNITNKLIVKKFADYQERFVTKRERSISIANDITNLRGQV